MKKVIAAVAIVGGVVSAAYAQDSLVGTWTGNYTFPGRRGDTLLGVRLQIASAEDGVVKGVATLSTRGACAGDYPMAGKYEENKLSMRATAKGGTAGDCSFSFNVVREGNRLVGTTGGGRPLQLSR